MPETVLPDPVPAPLTMLTEDEILFRDNIRQFADAKPATALPLRRYCS